MVSCKLTELRKLSVAGLALRLVNDYFIRIMRTLNSRSLEILDAVVRLNIETGHPVSSALVQRLLSGSVSSATIRNEMKGLEQQGYLQQPHTSAGRLPTDAGFRLFVNRLQAGWALTRHNVPEAMRQVAAASCKDNTVSTSPIKASAQLLSKLTKSIGIILGPTWQSVKAVKIELYPRSSSHVLLVVLLENGLTRTGMVTLPREYPTAVLQEAGELLSRRVAGRTVQAIRSGLLDSLDLIHTPATQCAACLAQAGKPIFDSLETGEMQLDGLGHVLDEPEFHHPDPLKALLRFIESPAAMRVSFGKLGQAMETGYGVWIGEEIPLQGMRSFTILASSFKLDGRDGLLAVVGPRRMSYQRAFHGMDIVKETLLDAGSRMGTESRIS